MKLTESSMFRRTQKNTYFISCVALQQLHIMAGLPQSEESQQSVPGRPTKITMGWVRDGVSDSEVPCGTCNMSGGRCSSSTYLSPPQFTPPIACIESILPKDPQFKKMHSTIDHYFREVCELGIGARVKLTSIISKDDESKLWKGGVLGIDYAWAKSLNHSSSPSIVYHNDPPHNKNGSKTKTVVKTGDMWRTRLFTVSSIGWYSVPLYPHCRNI